MSIPQKTAAQYIADYQQALLQRTKLYDVGFGDIFEAFILPTAAVLEDQNANQIRPVSLLQSLENSDAYSESDLDGVVFNEDILRPTGSFAATTLTFTRNTAFGAGETGGIPRGTPIGSATDASTSQSVTFVTTVAKDKTNAVAVLDTDTNQVVYRMTVPAVCLISGSAGAIAANQLTLPIRSISGWDSVTNLAAAVEGVDKYTNAELIELYFLAVTSRQLSVATGTEFHVLDSFTGALDVHEVTGVDPLLTRDSAGAVDVYVKGTNIQTATEGIAYFGVGQKLVLSNTPVISITSVVSGAVTYLLGSDYVIDLDDTGVAASTRANDGIRFLPTVTSPPAVGDTVNITYTYNQLIIDLQAEQSDPEIAVDGRDLLYKMGTGVPIYISARLTVKSGFVFSTIQTAVIAAIQNYVSALGLNDDVSMFNEDGSIAFNVSGVSSLVFTRFSRVASDTTINQVIAIAANEYPSLDLANLSIS